MEPGQSPANERPKRWEGDLPPEKQALKDFSEFVLMIAQMELLMERPRPQIAEMVDSFQSAYGGELPQEMLDQLRQRLGELAVTLLASLRPPTRR